MKKYVRGIDGKMVREDDMATFQGRGSFRDLVRTMAESGKLVSVTFAKPKRFGWTKKDGSKE